MTRPLPPSFPRKRDSIPHRHAAGTIGSYLDPSATPSEAFAWLLPPMDSRFRGNDGKGEWPPLDSKTLWGLLRILILNSPKACPA